MNRIIARDHCTCKSTACQHSDYTKHYISDVDDVPCLSLPNAMQGGMLVVFHLLAANFLQPLLALGGLTTAY